MTYNAIVTQLEDVREHPNADRLSLATVFGTTVVVGLGSQTGDTVIYFPADGQLSEEYCIKNDLFPRYEGEDCTKRKVGGGMFDPKNRRVRAQNLRQQRSDGYVASLESVLYTGVNLADLRVGAQFNELNGHAICNKYITQKTRSASQGQVSRKKHLMFKEHVETKQYAYNKDMLEPGDLVYISEKVHGTSSRQGLVFNQAEFKWWNPKTWRSTGEWEIIHGSRRVQLKVDDGGGFYGSNKFRFDITENFRDSLLKGETVYGEIVGWADSQTKIMHAPSTQALKKDEGFKALFNGNPPSEMVYAYGCLPGEMDLYIYRITHTTVDGEQIDLSWPQVKKRCVELGLKHVPELDPYPFQITEDFGSDDLDVVLEEFEGTLSTIDTSHISEGVALRVEKANGKIEFLKHKSWYFKVLEGIAKDSGVADVEESS